MRALKLHELSLADRLADVETGQIAHGERSHGHAEVAQRTIDLMAATIDDFRLFFIFYCEYRLSRELKVTRARHNCDRTGNQRKRLSQVICLAAQGGKQPAA